MAQLIKQKHGGAINRFEKGETGNRKGQPRKGVSFLNAKIKEKIGELPTKKQIEDIVIGMLELTDQELKAIVDDKESSVMTQIIAKELIDNNKSFNAFNILLDRAYGKAIQKQENTGESEIAKTELYKSLKGKIDTLDKNDLDNIINEVIK